MLGFFAAVFLISFSAWAQQPTPSPLPQPSINGQPDHKTKEPEQQPAAKNGDSGQPGESEREHTGIKANKNAGKAPDNPVNASPLSNSDKIAIVAGFIAFAQFLGLVWTIREMRMSSQREPRAYVFVDGATPLDGTTIDPPMPQYANIPAVSMVIKNSGQTPAYRIISFAAIDVADAGDETKLIVHKLAFFAPATLGSNGIMPRSIAFNRSLTDQEISDIRSRKKSIYLYGRIEYEDAFRKKRFTNFRLFYTGAYPPDIKDCFHLCQKGNETERDA